MAALVFTPDEQSLLRSYGFYPAEFDGYHEDLLERIGLVCAKLRERGLAGHWTYSLADHRALVRIYKRMRRHRGKSTRQTGRLNSARPMETWRRALASEGRSGGEATGVAIMKIVWTACIIINTIGALGYLYPIETWQHRAFHAVGVVCGAILLIG